jgi:NADPH:quinone reductase
VFRFDFSMRRMHGDSLHHHVHRHRPRCTPFPVVFPMKMRAVRITQPGGPEALQMRDAEIRPPGAGEVLVRVQATAVNRADLMQRRGNYPAPAGWPTDIPGLEYAGTVERCGEGARRFRGGERVMGIVGGGSYAEYVVVHEDEAIPVPDSLTLEEAAALPEAFITAFDALRVRLALPIPAAGSVLIHAVASGVGTAALQFAHAMGLRVFGTARSAWKLERIASLAPAMLIDASTQDFAEIMKSNSGADYIVDLVGGDYLEKNIHVANKLARIVVVGLVGGAKAELDMRTLLNKRITIVGTVLRARTLEEKIEAAQLFEREALPWIASGKVKPVIDRVLPLSEAAEAHRLAEENQVVGKIVLRVATQ